MFGCKKCQVCCGVIFLVLGLLFLLRDLGMWHFWNVQWWTALFLVLGVASLCKSKCAECQAVCAMPGKRR